MADNDDLMIEVTGSSDKAANAIDRVINKVTKMQDAVEKMVPSLTKFTERMDSLASSSKAFATLDRLTKSTGNVAAASKKAEANEAMYQARLARADVSMDKSRLQAEKLSNAFKKVSEAEAIAAHNNAAFSMPTKEFAQKYNTSTGNEGINLTPEVPTDTYEPTPAPGHTKLASEMGTPHKVSFNFSTGNVQSEIGRIQNFIDGLIPHVSHMSSSAQAQFNELAEKIKLVSQQIDNQRGLYHNLASAASQAAKESGEGSNSYLRIEKRMLSADSAMDRLLNKQEKLKAEMSSVASSTEKAGWGFSRLGSKGEKSASKTKSAWSSTMRMMKNMLVRIAAFRIFSALSQGITTGMQNMAQASNRANSAMSALATNSLYLKNSIAAALMPALQALTPVITQVADALADVFNMIAMLTARIFNHASTVTIAKRANVDYAATLGKAGSSVGGVGDKAKQSTAAVKELQHSLLGFDELNTLSKQPASASPAAGSGAGGAAGAGTPSPASMFETVKVPDWINNVGNFTDTIGKIIGDWWSGLTDAQKWGAGIGGTAGFVIGGIVGNLIAGPMGRRIGELLGTVVGVVIGAWWAGLTKKEKWGAGIGAGVGTVIGGIIGGILTHGNPIGIAVGAALGGTIGLIIGKWWADLTTSQKWGVGIGSGAGAIIGGIVGGILTGGNPIGIVVGVALGGTIGAIIGKWWAGLTTKQKWSVGIGAGAGTAIGGIIGGMIAGPIGAVIGGLLGGTIGTVIGNWWSGMTSKQKWSIGIGASAGTVIGGILGTLICPGIGTVLGATLGGTLGTVAGQAISKLTNPFKNIKWPKIKIPQISWVSGGWKSTGWIYDVLNALHLPTQLPKLQVKWYANGGIFDTPTIAGIGEAGPEAALPLNDEAFSKIAKGIVKNSGSSNDKVDTDRILDRMDKMEHAIENIQVFLYTDDKKIAESANRGNRVLGRTSPTAT